MMSTPKCTSTSSRSTVATSFSKAQSVIEKYLPNYGIDWTQEDPRLVYFIVEIFRLWFAYGPPRHYSSTPWSIDSAVTVTGGFTHLVFCEAKLTIPGDKRSMLVSLLRAAANRIIYPLASDCPLSKRPSDTLSPYNSETKCICHSNDVSTALFHLQRGGLSEFGDLNEFVGERDPEPDIFDDSQSELSEQTLKACGWQDDVKIDSNALRQIEEELDWLDDLDAPPRRRELVTVPLAMPLCQEPTPSDVLMHLIPTTSDVAGGHHWMPSYSDVPRITDRRPQRSDVARESLDTTSSQIVVGKGQDTAIDTYSDVRR